MNEHTPINRRSNHSFKSLFTKSSKAALNRSSLPVSVSRKLNNHSQESFSCAGGVIRSDAPVQQPHTPTLTPPTVPKRTTSLNDTSSHISKRTPQHSDVTPHPTPQNQDTHDSLQDIKATFERMKSYLASRDTLQLSASDISTTETPKSGAFTTHSTNKGRITQHTSPTVESLAVTVEGGVESDTDKHFSSLMHAHRDNYVFPRSFSTNVALTPRIDVTEHRSTQHSPLKRPGALMEMKTSTPTQATTHKRMSMPVGNSVFVQHHEDTDARPLTYPSHSHSLDSRSARISSKDRNTPASRSSLCSASSSGDSPTVHHALYSPGLTTPSTSTTSMSGVLGSGESLSLHRMSRNELFRLVVDTQAELGALKSRYALEKGALEGQLSDTLGELNDAVGVVHEQEAELERAASSEAVRVEESEMRQFIAEQQDFIAYQNTLLQECECVRDTDQSVVLYNTTQILHNKSNLLGDVTAPFNSRHKEVEEEDTFNSFMSNQSEIVDVDSTVHDENGLWTLGLDEDARRALDA